MRKNLYICGVFAKGIMIIAVAGIFISTTGKYRNYGLSIPCDFCTATVGNVFGETGMAAFSRLHTTIFCPQMPKTTRDCNGVQGMPIATSDPTKAGNINQFSALLHDLCKAKLSIDAFFEAQTEGVMFDCPDDYFDAENKLCDAICTLGTYVGMFAVDSFLTYKNS